MFDKDTWRFINTFAPWLSALGTFTAVSVSLYLARRSSRLDIRVFPAIVRLFSRGQDMTDAPEFLQLRAVNHGRSAIISGMGWWRFRWFRRKKNWLALHPDNEYSTQLPKKLEFGEEVSVLYPTDTFNQDGVSLLRDIQSSWFPSVRVRFMRVGFFASTGQQFRVPLDKYLRKFLVERASQISAE